MPRTLLIALIILLLTSSVCGCERQKPPPAPISMQSVETTLDTMKLSRKKKSEKNAMAHADIGGFERFDAPVNSEKHNAKEAWPPVFGRRYPDLTLMDHRGEMVHLSQFSGQVVLIEPIAMSCAGCNAFSGGNRLGSFPGTQSQKDLYSIEQYIPTYSDGHSLNDNGLIFIQIMISNLKNEPPNLSDLKAWAKHYHLQGRSNVYVLAGTKDLLAKGSRNMIPGFQLVDRNFILRSDSTGHKPRDNLFKTLLPMLPKLL